MSARGAVIRLATGDYTTDTSSGPERVVRREWRHIAGRLFADATIADRSARTAGPVGGPFIWSTHTTTVFSICPGSPFPCVAVPLPKQTTFFCPAACTKLRSPAHWRRTLSLQGLAEARSPVASPATNSANGSSAPLDLPTPASLARCAIRFTHWRHYSE